MHVWKVKLAVTLLILCILPRNVYNYGFLTIRISGTCMQICMQEQCGQVQRARKAAETTRALCFLLVVLKILRSHVILSPEVLCHLLVTYSHSAKITEKMFSF